MRGNEEITLIVPGTTGESASPKTVFTEKNDREWKVPWNHMVDRVTRSRPLQDTTMTSRPDTEATDRKLNEAAIFN